MARAARKAIASGTAPSPNFEIERSGAKGARDVVGMRSSGRGGLRRTARQHRSRRRSPVAAAQDSPKSGVAPGARSGRGRQSKSAELDAAALAGITLLRPIVTSQANIQGQKRFDYLAGRAAAGDWAAIKASAINSNNTQAKQLKRSQARLLVYYEAIGTGVMGRIAGKKGRW